MTLRRVATQQQIDNMREAFRLRVIFAMDKAMRWEAQKLFGPLSTEQDAKAGARDVDLPELFKAIDAQFDRNLAYLEIENASELQKDG